jgi:hypothetical protein
VVTVTVNVTANAQASVNNQVSVSGGGSQSANASDLTVIAAGTPITIQTSPAALQFHVDGAPAQTAPQILNLVPGTHTIAVDQLLTGSPGTQYIYSGWSDSGASSHSITVTGSAAIYTATFRTQYLLTTVTLPSAGGTITPLSGTYYDSGSQVNVTATPTPPYTFTSWSGDASGALNPLSVTMDAAKSVAANFNVPGFSCDLKGNGVIDISDVQLVINEALGVAPAVNDLNGDGVVNVIDVQIELNAALGLGCAAE